MNPLLLIPVGVFGFLGGAAFGRSRRGLSMLKPRAEGPIEGVPIASWRRFVTLMAVYPPSYRSPRGRMGRFGMDARRLCDVGFMDGARKETMGGEVGVWTGKWHPPLTTESFLGSTPAQYEAFRRSMAAMAPKVKGLVGRRIGGVEATLSGLLGVGHLAGEAAVEGWVGDAKVRRRFLNTSSAFLRTNGVF